MVRAIDRRTWPVGFVYFDAASSLRLRMDLGLSYRCYPVLSDLPLVKRFISTHLADDLAAKRNG